MNQVPDASMNQTLALPNGAAATTSTAVDTGMSAGGQQGSEVFEIAAPALTTTQQPDAKTLKYDVLWSNNADLSSPTTYITSALVQTGAGGVGAAAAKFRFRLPDNAGRYVFFKATGSASGDSSGASATLSVYF